VNTGRLPFSSIRRSSRTGWRNLVVGMLHLVSYAIREPLEDRQELSKTWVLAWGWTYFVINSVMTWSIIYKIG
jgi:hypothetical protein